MSQGPEDQPGLQRLKNIYLASNISHTHQPHLRDYQHHNAPPPLMVPGSTSPLRTEGEATGAAGGTSRKNTKSLTGLELLLPPVYKRTTRFISGVCRDYISGSVLSLRKHTDVRGIKENVLETFN